MTNFEKIKAMSVEEMANAFYNIISCEVAHLLINA